MITRDLKVLNELGIHARVASRIVRCAGGYRSDIRAIREGRPHDLKNVLGVMMLNTRCGESVRIEIEGPDETEAAQAMEQLFADKFGEK